MFRLKTWILQVYQITNLRWNSSAHRRKNSTFFLWKTDFHQTLWKTDFPQIPWKTEFNRNCVMENDFPQIPWKTRFHCRWIDGKHIFHKIYGKLYSTQFMETQVENYILYSTNSIENKIPQNLWKVFFLWHLDFKKQMISL